MKDHFGKELRVGQTVLKAYAISGAIKYRRLAVKGFTDKMVILDEGKRAKPEMLVVTREVV